MCLDAAKETEDNREKKKMKLDRGDSMLVPSSPPVSSIHKLNILSLFICPETRRRSGREEEEKFMEDYVGWKERSGKAKGEKEGKERQAF